MSHEIEISDPVSIAGLACIAKFEGVTVQVAAMRAIEGYAKHLDAGGKPPRDDLQRLLDEAQALSSAALRRFEAPE